MSLDGWGRFLRFLTFFTLRAAAFGAFDALGLGLFSARVSRFNMLVASISADNRNVPMNTMNRTLDSAFPTMRIPNNVLPCDAFAFVDHKFLRGAAIRVIDFAHDFNGGDAGHPLQAFGLLDSSFFLELTKLRVDTPPLALLDLDLKLSNPWHVTLS